MAQKFPTVQLNLRPVQKNKIICECLLQTVMFSFHREVRIIDVSFSFVFRWKLSRVICLFHLSCFFLCLQDDNQTSQQQIDTFLALPNILPKSITKV